MATRQTKRKTERNATLASRDLLKKAEKSNPFYDRTNPLPYKMPIGTLQALLYVGFRKHEVGNGELDPVVATRYFEQLTSAKSDRSRSVPVELPSSPTMGHVTGQIAQARNFGRILGV